MAYGYFPSHLERYIELLTGNLPSNHGLILAFEVQCTHASTYRSSGYEDLLTS